MNEYMEVYSSIHSFSFNCIIITLSKGDVFKHAKLMLNVSGMLFIPSRVC